MRALVISNTLPGLPSESSHGIFRRLDLFMEAIALVADKVDMLFYVHHDFDISNKDIIRKKLETRWGIKINLYLCIRNQCINTTSFWTRYIEPCFNFKRFPDYSEIANYQQTDALNQCLNNNPDFIFAHRLRSMIPVLLTDQKLPPVYFDMDDIEHIIFKRSIQMPPHWKSKWLYYFQLPNIKILERRAMILAKTTFICSELDKKKLLDLCNHGNIEVIPNALSMPKLSPLTKDPTILIIGQYKYEPNRIGIEFFLDYVWKEVLKQEPNTTLIVAGPSPEQIKHFNSPQVNVIFTGFCESLDDLYEKARIIVCPILSGGGTRVKIVEAASYGKPIISTTIGAEGLLFNNEQIILKDNPKDIADAIIELLRNHDKCLEYSSAIHSAFKNLYLKNNIAKNLAQTIQTYLR